MEKVLIGNKADQTDKKVIPTEQGAALAQEFGMAFFETSAKTGHMVQDTFIHISKSIKDKQARSGGGQPAGRPAETRAPVIMGSGPVPEKKKSTCC